MVVNRKTRSKPAAGAARTAGQALQKSTSAAESVKTDQPAVLAETTVEAVDPVADAAVLEPIVEVVIESVVEPMVEAVAEPVVEPMVEAVAEPVVEPMPESIVEPIPEPIPEPVVEPILETVIEATIEPELKPLAVLDVKPKAAPIVLEAEVLPTEPVMTEPVVAKATPAKTNPKVTQKSKGASAMTEAETPKTSAIAKADSGMVGMIYSAGERPIGASSMTVFGTILNGRPIEASSVKLFDILPGDRPVFADAITYVAGGAPGGRPVMVSPAGMLNAGVIMGYRPIFSNDDASDPNGELLMGYLD